MLKKCGYNMGKLITTLKLYSFVLVIPFVFNLIWFVWVVLGLSGDFKYGVVETLTTFWSNYFVTGLLGGVEAWRIHLSIFLVLYFLVFVNEKS